LKAYTEEKFHLNKQAKFEFFVNFINSCVVTREEFQPNSFWHPHEKELWGFPNYVMAAV
jgi:hypothetical protein